MPLFAFVCVEIVKTTPSVINYSSLGHCAGAPRMVVIWWGIGIIITYKILPRGSKPSHHFFLCEAVSCLWMQCILLGLRYSCIRVRFSFPLCVIPMYFLLEHLELISQLLCEFKPIASVPFWGSACSATWRYLIGRKHSTSNTNV